jgi:transketolase
MNPLHKRILDLSYKHKLSHLGSCLTSVDLIKQIYDVKEDDEPFILSNGHAGLALYVVLEDKYGFDAESLYKLHGTHPNRDISHHIPVSTGSLGQGLPIAVGMALADPTKNVYCMISDGECAEGSIWEALRIAGELRLENLRVVVNANGVSAYKRVDVDLLEKRLALFYPVAVARTDVYDYPQWLQGLNGHYQVMDELQYKEVERLYAANFQG